MKKTLLLAAMAIFALVGCEKQAQSELDLADVQQNATVSGQVVAYIDQAKNPTAVQPMANIRIYFEVAANLYTTGATGNKQFETVTDANGNFTITVPTGSKSISGKLKTDDFKTTQGEKTVYYEAYESPAAITVNAGDVRIESIKISKDALLSECIGTATVEGTVKYEPGYTKMADGTYEISKIARAEANVDLTVTYSGSRKKVYRTATDANGKYQFIVPVEDAGNAASVQVEEFIAGYTDKMNNQYMTQDYLFTHAAANLGNIKDGTLNQKDLEMKKGDNPVNAITTKGAVKITVSGKITKRIEEVTTNDKDLVTGVKKGSKAYAGEAYLRVENSTTGQKVYHNFTIDESDKGKYENTIALYDNWDLSAAGTIKVYVGVHKSFSEVLKHYYLGYEEDNDGYYKSQIIKWNDGNKDTYATQNLNVVYNADETFTTLGDAQLFFAVKNLDLELNLTAEDESIVLGVGNACDTQNIQTSESGHPYKDCVVGSNGIKVWE